MRKVVGYVVAFTAGTLLSGTAVFAATNYVQALSGTSTVSVNGNAVAHPPKLVYGGTTYVQLYSIQQGLKQLGINPTWDGSTFNMITSGQPSGSTIGGSTSTDTKTVSLSSLPYTYKSPNGMQITFNKITADSSGTVINVTLTNAGKVDGDSMMSTSEIMAGNTKVEFVAQDQAFFNDYSPYFHPGQSITGDVIFSPLPSGTTKFTLYYHLVEAVNYDDQSVTFDLSK